MEKEKQSIQLLSETLSQLHELGLPDQANALLEQAQKQQADIQNEQADLEKALEEVRTAQSKFVSVVTHELRLPLTSIKGYTDLLRQGIIGPINEQQQNFLNVIRNNVERMSALISDLSDMSHAEEGRIKLNSKTFIIIDQVQQIVQTWKARFEEKNLSCTVEIPADLQIETDPSRFNQILGYMISNAWKYTPNDGKIILRSQSLGDSIQISVSDSGVGIGQEDQEKVFMPFFRSDHEAVREHPGWGLALHVAKLLVGIMGGKIGFTSELNNGSTFWFLLPKNSPII